MAYEQVSVKEIRRMLREEHDVTDEQLLSSTKKVLVQHLLRIQTRETFFEDVVSGLEKVPDPVDIVDSVFDDAEEDSSDTAMQPYTEKEAKETLPAYASEDWHQYVMQQFRDDELVDDAPTCDGCRRVIEQILGPIVSSSLTHVHPPSTANNGTATIGVKIDILVNSDSHPLMGQLITCEEVADVNRYNCDHPYHKYASATASSRAEGRALRKLLRLRNVITAEESSEKAETTDEDCDWTPDTPISDSQINMIDMVCSRLDINVMDFVNSGRRQYDRIEEVNKSTAQRMCQELTKFQRKTKEKPSTIGAYRATWRTEVNGESEQGSGHVTEVDGVGDISKYLGELDGN